MEALLVDDGVAAGTARIATDGRSVIDVAREIVALTGWRRG